MQRGLLAVLGLTPVLFVFGCSSVQSDAERYPAEMSFLGKDRLHKSVSSWKELQQQNIIMQGHDYSCGAGALARFPLPEGDGNVSG
jgi:hypothetical protein